MTNEKFEVETYLSLRKTQDPFKIKNSKYYQSQTQNSKTFGQLPTLRNLWAPMPKFLFFCGPDCLNFYFLWAPTVFPHPFFLSFMRHYEVAKKFRGRVQRLLKA